MQINAYLNFPGTCAEAFKFYEKALGGKIVSMQTFGDSPMANDVPAEAKNMVVHARIDVAGVVLMGSDATPDRYNKPAGFSVSIQTDSPADADRIYSAMSDGGAVEMPIQETFWAARFAMFTDKYGIPWMVNCDKKV